MKLTKAQRRALERLGRESDDRMTCWGYGFGINRSSVRVLHRLGLAILDEEGTGGVCCRITDAGRSALSAVGGDKS
jgi:hypothetical protein